MARAPVESNAGVRLCNVKVNVVPFGSWIASEIIHFPSGPYVEPEKEAERIQVLEATTMLTQFASPSPARVWDV